jgi:heme-degrading monooxygenase HmoA
MFARVSTFEGPPETVDEGIRAVREKVIPVVRGLDGYRGLLTLVDRSTGRAVGITLWETEDAMHQSEEAASEVRGESADAGGGRIAHVERFEVMVDERV